MSTSSRRSRSRSRSRTLPSLGLGSNASSSRRRTHFPPRPPSLRLLGSNSDQSQRTRSVGSMERELWGSSSEESEWEDAANSVDVDPIPDPGPPPMTPRRNSRDQEFLRVYRKMQESVDKGHCFPNRHSVTKLLMDDVIDGETLYNRPLYLAKSGECYDVKSLWTYLNLYQNTQLPLTKMELSVDTLLDHLKRGMWGIFKKNQDGSEAFYPGVSYQRRRKPSKRTRTKTRRKASTRKRKSTRHGKNNKTKRR